MYNSLKYIIDWKKNNNKKVPWKHFSAGAPDEEHKHCGDGEVTEKCHEVVFNNLKKKPYH